MHVYFQRKTDSDLRSLRNSLSSVREELADLQDEHSSLQRSTTQTIASQKSQITTLTHQVSLLQEELLQTHEIANARSVTIDSLEAQLSDLSTSQTSLIHSTSEEQEDMRIVREELHRQAEYLRTVESKNTKLTAEVNVLRTKETSVEVLREEKRGLERKVRVMEELREKVVKLEAEVETGRREREAWFVVQVLDGALGKRLTLPNIQGYQQYRRIIFIVGVLQDARLYYQESIGPPTGPRPTA
jgi:mitotic spindle assembly checkpoint protein MAD1